MRSSKSLCVLGSVLIVYSRLGTTYTELIVMFYAFALYVFTTVVI
jgi:hypothetical protein